MDRDPDVPMVPVRMFSGAILMRETYVGSSPVLEHEHDFISLTMPLAGGFNACSDIGEAAIQGASAVLHPAGRAHAASIFSTGLEAIGLHCDPAWLRRAGFEGRLDRTCYWTGGRAGAFTRHLARAWLTGKASETKLAEMTARLLSIGMSQPKPSKPKWLDRVDSALSCEHPQPVRQIARTLDLHPAWLAQAYREAKGEGLRETVRRRRTERAIGLLRFSDHSLAETAIRAGFCDQSHMNRTFRALIGRTPFEVRKDAFPRFG